MDIYEKLATSKLDDDVKISVVPNELRDKLLVNTLQFEEIQKQLRASIQVNLNTNKSWIANDLRNEMRGSSH